MPKRAKTPPPAWDSEPTYFVVYQPYPINANMELSADRMRFAFWLACALGDPSHLFALFHKPSSPGMIIIEVNKSFTPHSSLLGAHQWSAILRAPARDEAERASKIYYCKYNTARQVEKAGWKRKMVEEAWFSKWRLDNSVITHPYPPTHACALPAETVTTEGLCRPLPVRLFPRPPVPASRLPPPGSHAYLAAKTQAASAPKPTKIQDLGLWGVPPSGRIAGGVSPSGRFAGGGSPSGRFAGGVSPLSDVRFAGCVPSSPSSSDVTPSPTSMSVADPLVPFGRAPDLKAAATSPEFGSLATHESGSLATPESAAPVSLGPPPGLVHPSMLYLDEEEEEEYLPLPTPSSFPFPASPTPSSTWELASHIYEAADMAASNIEAADMAASNPEAADMAPPSSSTDNLWAGYGKEHEEEEGEEMCPDHGATCGRGICVTRKEIERRRRREEREGERGRGRGRGRGIRGGDRGRGRGKGRGSGSWDVDKPAWDVGSSKSKAWDVDSSTSKAWDVDSSTSKAWDVDSSTSKAWDVDSSKSKAWDVDGPKAKSACDIDGPKAKSAWDIDETLSPVSTSAGGASDSGSSKGKGKDSSKGKAWDVDGPATRQVSGSSNGKDAGSSKGKDAGSSKEKDSSKSKAWDIDSSKGKDSGSSKEKHSSKGKAGAAAKSVLDKAWDINSPKAKSAWSIDGTETPSPISESTSGGAVSESTSGGGTKSTSTGGTESVVGVTLWDVTGKQTQMSSSVGRSPSTADWGDPTAGERWASESVVGATPWDGAWAVTGKQKQSARAASSKTGWAVGDAKSAAPVRASWADMVAEEEEAAASKSRKEGAAVFKSKEGAAAFKSKEGAGFVSAAPKSRKEGAAADKSRKEEVAAFKSKKKGRGAAPGVGRGRGTVPNVGRGTVVSVGRATVVSRAPSVASWGNVSTPWS